MDLARDKNPLQIWQIAKHNLRHNFILHLLLAAAIVILTPVLFGISELDVYASAVPLEMFASLIGIVLLVPIFQPEHNPEIEGVVASKYVSCLTVSIIRIAYSLLGLILLMVLLSIIMAVCGCAITPTLVFGSIVTAIFLGSLGVFTASLSGNIAVSYMVPMIYYILNFSGGSRFGHFYLFSMMHGVYEQKLWLFGASVVLIVLTISVKLILEEVR